MPVCCPYLAFADSGSRQLSFISISHLLLDFGRHHRDPPIHLIFVHRINQHHAYDLLRELTRVETYIHAPKRMTNQN